jgi:putative transposase
MKPISYARHRFPPDVIRHAVWLYLRFTLSYRDVEDLLAERGLIISNEAVRRWMLKFGPVIARNLRTSGPKAYALVCDSCLAIRATPSTGELPEPK